MVAALGRGGEIVMFYEGGVFASSFVCLDGGSCDVLSDPSSHLCLLLL